MGVYDAYTNANQMGLNNLINSRMNAVASPRISSFMSGLLAAQQRQMEQQKLDTAQKREDNLSQYRLQGLGNKESNDFSTQLVNLGKLMATATDPQGLAESAAQKAESEGYADRASLIRAMGKSMTARTPTTDPTIPIPGMGVTAWQKQQEIEDKKPVLAATANNLNAQADFTKGAKTDLTGAQTTLANTKAEDIEATQDPRLEKLTAEIELLKHNSQKPFTVNINGAQTAGSANWDRLRKAESEKTVKDQALQGTTYDLDRLGQAASELKDHPGLGRITGVMSLFPNMPGDDAANAAAKLDTLKSQIAFNVLQSLRSMSKTGGALGQVSDKEEAMLSNNLAALDAKQGTPEFKKALDRIIQYTKDVKGRLANAAKLDMGEAASAPTTTRSDASGTTLQSSLPKGATEMGVENGKTWYRWASDGRRHTAPPQVMQ